MMISRRRLTLARSFSLGVVLLFVILVILRLSKNRPLDLIATYHERVVGRYLDGGAGLSAAGGEGAQHQRSKAFRPCELHRLRRREQPTTAGEAHCRRVQPVSGSCDVAERLFHSSPPATCKSQSSVDICKLKVSSIDGSVFCVF